MKFFLVCFTVLAMRTGFAQQTVSNGDSASLPQKNISLAGRESFSVTAPVLNDPKQGFKDLFIAKTNSQGINVAQLNPRAVNFVQDYMQKHGKNLERMKDWGRPYFDMIDAILTLRGLPRELKYLAVIESHLKTYAVSWAGAVGPWQFMPETGRRMGLRITSYSDERTDYYKSTHAAARYLTELYAIYGDWLLVIAAYNGGPGNVNSAIRKSGSRDFWKLQYNLPAESREHVKKFIATHYIMEGEGSITTLTKDEVKELAFASAINPAAKNLTAEELSNSTIQPLSGKYNSVVISKHLSFPITEFNRYNPDFDKLIAMNGNYELRLPADKMELFAVKRFDILNESIQVLLDAFRQSLESPAKTPAQKKSSR